MSKSIRKKLIYTCGSFAYGEIGKDILHINFTVLEKVLEYKKSLDF